MPITIPELEAINARINDAWQMLKLDEVQANVTALEEKMSEPDFWTDQKKARAVSQEVSGLKDQLKGWKTMREEVKDLIGLLEMAQTENDAGATLEVEASAKSLEAKLRTMELDTMLGGEFDHLSAIVTIHAGAGGTDAMDWAGMLARMLTRFAEHKGFEVHMLHESRGEEAGFKSVSFAIRGRFAYGYLKSEHGVHRLVRVSPFDAEQMRHTAFAQVEVIPELDEVSERQLEIDPNDLRIDTYMAGGKGGQSVNTTYSAVRITHIPTNTVVTCQNERSQSQNKETAMRVLKSRLLILMKAERADKLTELRGERKSAEWGSQIRSYVIHPYQLVKDHRTAQETTDVQAVFDGDLMPFIEAYLKSTIVVDKSVSKS